jgi:two-component system, chemotaxis family, chemotaxis protein CheY
LNPEYKDVIIIDDDPGVCEVLSLYCENLGIFRNIVVANDGALGYAKLKNQKFSLILLDINMPKKSGIDILEKLSNTNEENSPRNVIIVSGEVKQASLQLALRQGVKIFLIKPFDEKSFVEKVKLVIA